ncbi:hypothetical protein AB3N59_11115 [Leptospira sp. WS92.C1]
MELFAVLAINAVISVVLYYTITSKVTERIRTHMLKKINEEIREFVDELETESMRQVDLIGSRILTFKEMTSKVEELVRRIEQATTPEILDQIQVSLSPSKKTNLVSSAISAEEENVDFGRRALSSKIPGTIQQGIGYIYKENLELNREDEELGATASQKPIERNLESSKPFSRPSVVKKEISATSKQTDSAIPGSTSNLVLETIGKGVRKFFGIQEIKTITEEKHSPVNDFFPGIRNSTLDISLDEDPFAPVPDSESAVNRTPSFKDNLKPKEADFGRILQENVIGYKPPRPDSAKISAEAALLEIGEDSTKIEKVVFLLKRKYSHEEISEVLDLALGEVDIIERFRLDRNRRF